MKNVSKLLKLLALSLTTCGVLTLGQATLSPLAASTFSVDGNTLKDSNGNNFIMRGINMPNIWFDTQSFKDISKSAQYGSNTIRVVWDTSGKASRLDQILAEAKKNKMVIIPELHDVTGNSSSESLQAMANYWSRSDIKSVLNKYSDCVIVNIANEWGEHSTSASYWKDSYISAIRTMRNAGIKGTIMVDAPGWGQNADAIIQEGKQILNSDPQRNVMFSVHMYASFNDSYNISSKLQAMKDQGLCVVVGEFGYNFSNGNNNLGCTVNADEVMKQCNDKSVGYLAWSWYGNDQANSWLDLVNNWSGNLTSWGQKVFYSPYGIKNTSKTCSVFTGGSGNSGGSNISSKITIEAENGYKNGTYTSTNRYGYSGKGYVTGFDNYYDYIEVTVNVPSSGNYHINTQYASEYDNKYTSVFVNNSHKGDVFLNRTYNFRDCYLCTTYLNAGKNTIKLQSNWGYYDIDNFTVTKA